MSNPESSSHTWNFFRTGGLDQVSLKTGADLLGLRNLDQKLWVALSCPVKGLELDDKTLALIDSDNDGRIRVPELIDSVEWAAARLKDPGELVLGRDSLPLSSIDAGDLGLIMGVTACGNGVVTPRARTEPNRWLASFEANHNAPTDSASPAVATTMRKPSSCSARSAVARGCVISRVVIAVVP